MSTEKEIKKLREVCDYFLRVSPDLSHLTGRVLKVAETFVNMNKCLAEFWLELDEMKFDCKDYKDKVNLIKTAVGVGEQALIRLEGVDL